MGFKGCDGKVRLYKRIGRGLYLDDSVFVSPVMITVMMWRDYYNIDPRYGTMEDFEELSRGTEAWHQTDAGYGI